MKYKYLKLITITLAGIIAALSIYLLTQQYQKREDNFSDYKTGVSYPTNPITLQMWLPSDEKHNFESTIDEFRKIHPSVTFDIKYFDVANYQNKLIEASNTTTLPDLFVFRDDGLPLYKKNIAPAPESVFTKDQFDNTFCKFANQQLLENNNIFGAPLGLATLGIIYNKQKFEEADIQNSPDTWDSFVEENNKLRKKDGENLFASGVALGTSSIRNYNDIISILMMQNGAIMTDLPPTKATFQIPQANGYSSSSKALAFYASFAQPTKQNYSWSDALGSSISAFSDNKTGLIIDYPMTIKQIKASNKEIKTEFGGLPQINTNQPINYGILLTGGVAKNSKYSEIAWDFWGFATSKTAQRDFSIKSYWPASRKDLIKEQLNDKDLDIFAKQSESATSWYKGVNYQVNNELKVMLNEYLRGLDVQISVNNAASKITKEIQTSNK